MLVVALEGAQGVGKTTLLHSLEAAGYAVEGEVFCDVSNRPLHPQSFLNETVWVGEWFQRVMRRYPSPLLIVDRSPHSAVCYAHAHNTVLHSLVNAGVRELRDAGINIVTLNITCREDVLWNRVTERLAREPAREKLNEGSLEHLRMAMTFYDEHPWDHQVDNTDGGALERVLELLRKLAE